jgi:hypothetical protein
MSGIEVWLEYESSGINSYQFHPSITRDGLGYLLTGIYRMQQHRCRAGKGFRNAYLGKTETQPIEDVVAANRDWYQMRD